MHVVDQDVNVLHGDVQRTHTVFHPYRRPVPGIGVVQRGIVGMEGKPPVNVSLPVHVIIKLIQIVPGEETSGIGFAVPLLVKGIINPHIGVHAF